MMCSLSPVSFSILLLLILILLDFSTAFLNPKVSSSSSWSTKNSVTPATTMQTTTSRPTTSTGSQLYFSSTTSMSPAVKNEFITIVKNLKDEYGIFLVEKTAKDRLKVALESLERSYTGPAPSYSVNPSLLLGDWELICTTASDVQGFDIPSFLNQGPLKDIRDSIRKTTNKYVNVQQRLLATAGRSLDRIDHVLEFDPPSELRDLLESLPEQISNVNINPLQVKKSKVVLIHKASVESDMNPLLIKLSLNQVVWNVAGTSTVLDPAGRDFANINIPFGEMLNGGDFETTYVDETLRISRGKQGFVNDQVRIFMRTNSIMDFSETAAVDPEIVTDDDDDSNIETPSDVEVL